MVNNQLNENNKDIIYITLLQIISAFAVVILHGSIFRFDAANPSNYWFISNFIMSFFFFAVPIFYMISGATLINYNERYDTKTFFIKRITKTFIPYVFWLIFYCLFRIYFMKQPVTENILLFIFNDGISGSLYWFFIPLFGIYLIIPLLSNVPKNKRIKAFTFYSIILFIISSTLPAITTIFSLNIASRPDFTFACALFIYPLLGYILNEVDLSKKYRIIFYALGILGLLGIYLPTQIYYDSTYQVTYMFRSYSYPMTILLSIAVWIFIKQISKHNFSQKFLKVIYFIKPYTFGIYLIHCYLVIGISYYLKWDSTSFAFSIIIPIIVIPLSILILFIMKKIPYMRYIVP